MKKFSLNITTIITLVFVGYIAYYFLLDDNFLHISITSIIANSQDLTIEQHMLVLAFLPVYIATMIFGAAMLGIYLGSLLKHLLIRIKK